MQQILFNNIFKELIIFLLKLHFLKNIIYIITI